MEITNWPWDYDEDRALEQMLRAAEGEFTQKNLAGLAFHWTVVGVYGESERHELTNSLWKLRQNVLLLDSK